MTARGFKWYYAKGYETKSPKKQSIQLSGQSSKAAQFIWFITIPDTSKYLTVSGIIKSSNILSGKKPWHGGRLDLQFLDNQGKVRWDLKREVIKLIGSNDWKRYEKTFPVPKKTRCARLVISNSGTGGTLAAEDITVTDDIVSLTFLFWKKIAAVALLILLCVGLFIQKGRAGYFLLSLAVLITIGTTLPNNIIVDTVSNSLNYGKEAYKQYVPILNKSTVSPEVTTQINSKVAVKKRNELRQKVISFIKKGGHFGMYILLGFWTGWRIRHRGNENIQTIILYGMILILFAISTETAQFFTVTRTPQLHDLLLNFSGLATGYIPPLLFKGTKK